MKKIVSGMIAVMLLVFTMGTTVFASPSPNGETAIKEKSEQLNNQISQDKISCSGADGKSITVEKKALNVEQYNAANLEVAKQNGKKNSEGTIMAMTDLSVPQGTDTSKGIKMTLAVSGVMKGDNIVVLHRKSDGTWETPSVTVNADGTITFRLTSLSPLVIVRYPAQTSSGGSSSGGSSSGSSSSGGGSSVVTPPQNNSSNGNNSNNNNNNNNNNSSSSDANTDTDKNSDSDSDSGEDEDLDDGSYDEGYEDGYSDGKQAVKDKKETNSAQPTVKSSVRTENGVVTSPKTGASIPALPVLAVFALAGISVCAKKAKNN